MRLLVANCQPQNYDNFTRASARWELKNYGNYGNFCRFFFLNPFFGLQIMTIDAAGLQIQVNWVNWVQIASPKIMIILPVRLHDGN